MRQGAVDLDAGALLDLLPEMVVVIANDLTISYVNQRLLDGMGYEREAVIGSNIFDYVHPDDHDYLAGTWASRSAHPGETGILIEARGRNADGTWRPVEILGLSLLEDPAINGMVMTLRDLARKVAKGDTVPRERALMDRATDVVLLVDADGRIGYANRRVNSRFGLDQDDAVGTMFHDLVPARERERFGQWFRSLVDAGDRAEARIRLPVEPVGTPESTARIVEWLGTNQVDEPLISGIILSGRDVTELVDMERRLHAQTEQLRHSADHDALTGLANRSAFIDELTAQLHARRAAADPGDAVVLFCDLDRFKHVNDTHGHAAGDHVLRVAADRLHGCVREGDVVARWGGDEFTILLHGSPSETAVAELIASGDVTAAIGVTIGSSRAPIATADASALLRTADEAMYAKKPTR